MTSPPDRAPTAEPAPRRAGFALIVCDDRGDLLVRNEVADWIMAGGASAAEKTANTRESTGNAEHIGSFLEGLLRDVDPASRRRLPLRDPATGGILEAPAVGHRIVDQGGNLVGAVAVIALEPSANGGRAAGDGSDGGDRRRARLKEQEGTAFLPRNELELVSHELRTPINAVVGYATLLEEGILGDLNNEGEQAVRRIKTAAQQLLTAVNHALLLAHIEVGDFTAGDFSTRRGAGNRSASTDARDGTLSTS